ncbi:MAG: DUF4167 domain-containing protein [Pseudomonadota bacterium]
MRHNQNTRRVRGRSNNGGDHGGGHHHNSGNGQQQGGRRVNLRVQSFDSNGPDVRIRGTAYQINEKYVTLARDATSAGDHVLAESYLQHAEHYQRFINEMTEEMNLYNQQPQQHLQQQPQTDGNGPTAAGTEADKLNDLDQGFLVGPRHGAQPQGGAETPQPSGDRQEKPQGNLQGRHPRAGRPCTPPPGDEPEAM